MRSLQRFWNTRRSKHERDCFSSTTQLVAAIQAGEISATESLEAHLAQIDLATTRP
jgi:Asp-tRNA(Asn)/Glu-tRNA(Gln) amidotransferase A subunit family amidase